MTESRNVIDCEVTEGEELETDKVCLESVLMKEFPKMDKDFGLDLAYKLGIGRDFKVWLSTQHKKDLATQAQQILRMWGTLYGDELTREKIIAALEKMPRTGNLLCKIEQIGGRLK